MVRDVALRWMGKLCDFRYFSRFESHILTLMLEEVNKPCGLPLIITPQLRPPWLINESDDTPLSMTRYMWKNSHIDITWKDIMFKTFEQNLKTDEHWTYTEA